MSIGVRDFKGPKTGSPKKMEYVGRIVELQGMTALCLPYEEFDNGFIRLRPETGVLAVQFDAPVKFNGAKLNLGWHPFTPDQFKALADKRVF